VLSASVDGDRHGQSEYPLLLMSFIGGVYLRPDGSVVDGQEAEKLDFPLG
jgi:hypothetical protein